jgi:small GTP-binding protein
MSEFRALQELAADLRNAARGEHPALAVRAERVAKRLAEGRFHVMVVGEFKRGKSTLVNALLGTEVLPTGVLPLTAVMTEVVHGEEGATVTRLDGDRFDIALEDLTGYATEAGNPGNERRVERVEVRVPAELLASGVVLVDTPGIGSIHLHNTEVGRASLLEADGAIVVLSADEPLSDEERELLETLSQRRARTFVVVNKADHLDTAELGEVRMFITAKVTDALGEAPELYCVAARAALAARRRGLDGGLQAVDWGRFVAAFDRFVGVELVDAQLAAARAELGRVGEDLRDAVLIRRAALDLDVAALSERVDQFRAAAAVQQQPLVEDRLLLGHDVDALMAQVGESLAAFAQREPARWRERLVDAAASLPIGELEDGLRGVVEHAVRESFEAFRVAESARVERAWCDLAARFRARTQERVDAVRNAAGDLLAIKLPVIVVPAVSEERERFFYLFLHVGSSSESLDRVMRRLLPAGVVRRRMLARANDHLVREFDKHAGRARWDLAQRLDGMRRRFEAAMGAELDRTVEAILAAASRAEELRAVTFAERDERVASDAQALRSAELALAAVR